MQNPKRLSRVLYLRDIILRGYLLLHILGELHYEKRNKDNGSNLPYAGFIDLHLQ
jgi:hypothetical protein